MKEKNPSGHQHIFDAVENAFVWRKMLLCLGSI